MADMTREQALDCVDSWSKRFDGLSRSEIRKALATLRAEIARLEGRVEVAKDLLKSSLILHKCDDEFIAAQMSIIDAAKGASHES